MIKRLGKLTFAAMSLSVLFYALLSSPALATGLREDKPAAITDDKGVSMVYVPSGEYTMGVELEKAIDLCQQLIPESFRSIGCNPEVYQSEHFIAPATTVSVVAFYIDQFEVSLRSYIACLNADVCSIDSLSAEMLDSLQSGDQLPLDYPVEHINYFDAAVYCAWRGGRLPTEAEWEYAASGSQDSVFPWGNDFDPTRLNFGDSIYRPALDWDDGYLRAAPVDSFASGQSWVGAYNLAGNVAEWTSTQLINDDGLPQPDIRIVKGGSYLSYAHETSGWERMPLGQIDIPDGIGFRCARSILPS